MDKLPIAPHAGPLGRAAGIMFITPDGETLLLCRGDGGDFPRTFGFPGGHLEEGEDDEQAARREALEETGYAYEGALTRLCGDPQFTTFVARDVEKFTVALCDESTGFVWCKPGQAPAPLHPGIDVAFRIAAAETELDVARLIRDGLLPSPQVFRNSMLFALRITGTGHAYRSEAGEHVWRDPSIWLNEEVLARCNGLPVVWKHPKKDMIDTKSHAETVIGSILLPYISGEDVMGIGRVIDMVAGAKMASEQWSTSPGVVFAKSSGNVKVSLNDEKPLLIEGNPVLIDHLAICEVGVWDKEGPAEGVQVDQPIEVKMDKTGEVVVVNDSQPSLSDVMKAVQALAEGQGKISSRMDSFEKNMPAEPIKSASDAKKDADEMAAKDKAKKDADDDEAMKQKAKMDAKKDADEKEEKAKKDAAEEQAKKDADMTKCDADETAYADAQARADGVYAMFGKSAPRRMDGERLMDYRKRLARPHQVHSGAYKDAKLETITDSAVLKGVEDAIYNDAAAASRTPGVYGAGQLIAMQTRDAAGRTITKFGGDVEAFLGEFKIPEQRVTAFHSPQNPRH